MTRFCSGGAIGEIPEAIAEQLAENGRMIAVVAGRSGVGKATLFTRQRGALSSRVLFDAATPMLPGFEMKAGFVF